MSEDLFIDLMDQWLAADPLPPRIHPDKVVKPEMLFHYEDGFRIGERHTLKRTQPVVKKGGIISRGAHP